MSNAPRVRVEPVSVALQERLEQGASASDSADSVSFPYPTVFHKCYVGVPLGFGLQGFSADKSTKITCINTHFKTYGKRHIFIYAKKYTYIKKEVSA